MKDWFASIEIKFHFPIHVRTWRHIVENAKETKGSVVRSKIASINHSEVSKRVFSTWRSYIQKRKQNIQGSTLNFVL